MAGYGYRACLLWPQKERGNPKATVIARAIHNLSFAWLDSLYIHRLIQSRWSIRPVWTRHLMATFADEGSARQPPGVDAEAILKDAQTHEAIMGKQFEVF